MAFSRRTFLGGLVATATMAEAGALAEFLDWVRRAPAFSIPNAFSPHSIFGDGVKNEFILASEPLPGSCYVLLNGILLGEGRDFKMSGPVIRFEEAPSNGDYLVVHSVKQSGLEFRAEYFAVRVPVQSIFGKMHAGD